MSLIVKICGLSDRVTLDAALDAGADLVGFVFHLASPRNVGVAWASGLRDRVADRAGVVALTVNASDRDLAEIVDRVRPAWLQFHGSETPERVSEVRARFGLPIMKAVPIRGQADVADADRYRGVSDMVLFDAKPPIGATLPGGNGVRFEWRLLRGVSLPRPYMVSGGLDAGNVGTAIAITQPDGVDVSSGVETAPGRKDPDLIRAFIAAARVAELPAAQPAGAVS